MRALLRATGTRLRRAVEERFPFAFERRLAEHAEHLGLARLDHPGLAHMAALRVERAGPLRLRGEATRISAGDVRLFGRSVALGEHFDWSARSLADAGLAWRRRLHSFPFAIALAEAHERTRALAPRETLLRIVHGWRETHPAGRRGADQDAWHAPTSAERWSNLVASAALLDLDARDPDRSWLARLLALHVVWLQAHGSPGGSHRLREQAALAIAAEIFPGASPALSELEALVAVQLRADGAHASGSPRAHALVLCDLLDVAVVLDASAPRWLVDAIARASGWLEAMLPDDGRLPLFGASWRGDVDADALLAQASRITKPREPSPADCAAPAGGGLVALRSDDAHAVLRACAAVGDAAERAHARAEPAHDDVLSFTLWFGSVPVIDEAGAGCLDVPADRTLAALARSHAMLIVERGGRRVEIRDAQAVATGRDGDVVWAWARACEAGCGLVARGAAHDAGGPDEREASARRGEQRAVSAVRRASLRHHRLLALSPRAALVLDVVLGQGDVVIESGLPFDPRAALHDLACVALDSAPVERETLPRFDRPERVSDLHRRALRRNATLPAVTGWLIRRDALSASIEHDDALPVLSEGRVSLRLGSTGERIELDWDLHGASDAQAVRVRLGASPGSAGPEDAGLSEPRGPAGPSRGSSGGASCS